MASKFLILLFVSLFGVGEICCSMARTVVADATPVPPHLEITLEARPPDGVIVDVGTMTATRDVIRRRLDELGVTGAIVVVQGENQIVVGLPSEGAPDSVVTALQTALLEIIDPNGQFLPEGTEVRTTLGGTAPGPVYTTIISGADIADAFPTQNQLGQPAVGFRLTGSAADRFFQFTSSHLGEPMSIVLDKVVISSPVINGAISNEGIIEGIPAEEVDDHVALLKSGLLPVPLEIVQSRIGSGTPEPNSTAESVATPTGS